MGKFNQVKQAPKTATVNLAGGKAYKESAKLEFASILLTSFVQDQFYRKESDILQRLNALMDTVDPLFAAKAAIYARKKYGMRSITHVVAGEIAKRVKGAGWTRRFFSKVINRPDDMLEIVSYYAGSGKVRPLPNAMRKGFAEVLAGLDHYRLAKYKKDDAAISMIDLVNLVHPRATPALTALMKGTLKPAETWETKLTQAGQRAESDEDKAELKGQAWTALLGERKLGYFALLRNLRNIVTQAPDMIDEACSQLTEVKAIKSSLVLPFRFATAYDELAKDGNIPTKVMKALNKALEISCANCPSLPGKTLVVVDGSGSMQGRPAQIADLFAAVLVKSNDADVMLFSDDAKYVRINPDDTAQTIRTILDKERQSAGTNFNAPFVRATRPYDRIVILSDMQGWMDGGAPTQKFSAYKTKFSVNPYVYSWDLQGYGTLQFPEQNVFCLAGFSDKVFDLMKMLEEDKNALVREIEKEAL